MRMPKRKQPKRLEELPDAARRGAQSRHGAQQTLRGKTQPKPTYLPTDLKRSLHGSSSAKSCERVKLVPKKLVLGWDNANGSK